MATAYLGIGGNLGDRRATLRAALASLPPAVRPVAVSSLYETEPVGYRDQPDFLNAVVQVETDLLPRSLLKQLKGIEQALGRSVRFRNAPRTVDLDILFYEGQVIDEADLTIPHARLAERAFVLAPLAELAPELWHPWLGRPISELLAALDDPAAIRLVEGPTWASGLLDRPA